MFPLMCSMFNTANVCWPLENRKTVWGGGGGVWARERVKL